MFPWSPSKVEVGTFYPFILEVGSKYTYILLEALLWSQQIHLQSVFTHVASICANLWEQKKAFTQERVQLAQDWFATPTWPPFHCFGTPTWPPFHCFGTPIWPLWRHVKTLNSLRREREGGFRARAVSLPNSILLPFRVKHLDLHSESRVMHWSHRSQTPGLVNLVFSRQTVFFEFRTSRWS